MGPAAAAIVPSTAGVNAACTASTFVRSNVMAIAVSAATDWPAATVSVRTPVALTQPAAEPNLAASVPATVKAALSLVLNLLAPIVILITSAAARAALSVFKPTLIVLVAAAPEVEDEIVFTVKVEPTSMPVTTMADDAIALM